MIKLYFEHKSELLITLFNFVLTEISFLLFLEILPDDYGYCLDQSTIQPLQKEKSLTVKMERDRREQKIGA